MFVNTQIFREPALHFKKYGRYADGDYQSPEWYDYWDREHERVENGYTSGGVTITGKHYMYLNYLPIKMVTGVKDNSFGVQKSRATNARKVGKRTTDFPAFWDEDYVIWHLMDIARYGITPIELKELSKYANIPIVKTSANLGGGHHFGWTKPRGVGASFKAAVYPIYNQTFITGSETYLVAEQTEYLTKGGLWDKYQDYRNHLLRYSDDNDGSLVNGFKRLYSVNDTTKYHTRASYRGYDLQGNKIEKGKRSSVYGVNIDLQPKKIRGKRGDIIWEEAGSFPSLEAAWQIAQESVEENGVVYGFMLFLGTGGDDNGGLDSMQTMFFDPATYNLLQFHNDWDKGMYEKSCAYFTPAYKNITHMDKDGNSLIDVGKAFFDAKRETLEDALDPTALTRHKAEKPYSPSEAFQSIHTNLFPVDLLKAHELYLSSSKVHRSLVTNCKIERNKGILELIPDPDAIPLEDYPIKKGMSQRKKDSAVCVLHRPFKVSSRRGVNTNGSVRSVVPSNLYRISVDPYRHDDTTGDSVGAIYVMENPNRHTHTKGDIIVAWYVGRPKTQAEFNKILFELAELYNCKIAPENDEPGGIIEYAKKKKLQHYLEDEFELAYDIKIQSKTKKGRVGMHIGSGKNNLRLKQGDKYIEEWLKRSRGFTKEGKEILNLHTIMDIGLIKELINYGKGNVDRISSLRINMYYEREYEYKELTVHVKKKAADPVFARRLFA